MLWFIFGVAVVNLGVGFGLAVYLAGNKAYAAPDEPTDSLDLTDVEGILGALPSDSPTTEPSPAASRSSSEPSSAPPNSSESSSDAVSEEESPKEAPSATDSEPMERSVMADLDAAVASALGEGTPDRDANAEKDADNAAEAPESSLKTFQAQLDAFCGELVALDERLRNNPEPETADLQSYLDSVANANQKHESAREEVQEALRTMADDDSQKEQADALIAAIDQERQHAEKACETLDQSDAAANTAAERQRVLDHSAEWIGTNHSLRDAVAEAIPIEVGGEGAPVEDVDSMTQVMSRAGLEAFLEDLWRKDPHHARALNLTIFDVDRFAQVNGALGPKVGDRVLRTLADLLKNEARQECLVARFSGQQFALLAIDRDLDQATGDAERHRQTIETMTIEHGNADLTVTASAGVTAATAEDTPAKLYARALEAVKEAKRYGRNRTFLHDGEFTTPVVPPNLSIAEKRVTI